MNAPVTRVTVLEDRAAITRSGQVSVEAGQHRLTIERVSPVLADKTLIAVATGARVLDARCERYLAPWRDPAAGPMELPATLQVERTALVERREAVVAQARAAGAEAEALAQLARAALHDLAVGASRGTSASSAAARLAELDGLERAARRERVERDAERGELDLALARLDRRVASAEAEVGEDAARLVIDLIADTAGEVVVTVDYLVPGAAWRPYHRARLARGGTAIDWETTACVWQATGEDWVDAALTFSLERPSLGVEPPELVDDVLAVMRKPDLVVETREQEHHSAGLGASLGASGAPVVPGIDDGGLGLVLTAARATVRADGSPHRVPISRFTAPAVVTHVAIPLRSPWVHVKATLANSGTAPLLAGPVDLVMDAGYVGRTAIGFVGAGEQVHVGFGPDADLRVHRTETSERDDAGLLGGWNVTTLRVVVRLSNLGTTARAVTVTERIPISEVEQVQVQLLGPDAYLLTSVEKDIQVTPRMVDERGMVTWSIALPPHGRRAVTLEYKVKRQRGVAGV